MDELSFRGLTKGMGAAMSRFATVCIVLLLSSTTFGQTGESVCVKHIEVPEFGPLARAARLAGKVTVSFTIDADGKVVEAKGTGAPGVLCTQSEMNIRLWTFTKPTSAPRVQTIVYVYLLEGPPSDHYYSHATFDLPEQVTITSRVGKPDH